MEKINELQFAPLPANLSDVQCVVQRHAINNSFKNKWLWFLPAGDTRS
jgi:hypothetical protein